MLAPSALRTGKLIKKYDQAKDINPLSWEEKARFEAALKDHFPRWYPFFLTALRTGMRLGELVALQSGDLDFHGRFIEVRRNFTKGHLSTTKSGKIRRVDMSKELQETLKVHTVERKKDTLKNGWREPPEWLFYQTMGGMIDPDRLRRKVFSKILEKAGLRHLRIHDLRHTYATLRISKGETLWTCQSSLGTIPSKLPWTFMHIGSPVERKPKWMNSIQLRHRLQVGFLVERDNQKAHAPLCTLYAPRGCFDTREHFNNGG